MRQVFITGGSGFIGNAVASAFQNNNDSVVCLCHSAKSRDHLQTQGLTAVVGDMAQPESWLEHAKRADIIVHAAHLRPGMRLSHSWLNKAATLRDHTLSALVQAARSNVNCKALIYTSGMIAHGDHGDALIDEATPSTMSALGGYHLAGEAIMQCAAQSGVPAFSIRPGMVYGPTGTFGKFFLAVAEKGSYRYPGNGNNFLPFVHIDDLAQAYLLAAEKPPVGQFVSVVDDQPIQVHAMAKKMLSAFNGGKASSVPSWLVGLFAGAPLAEMLTGSYRIQNSKAKQLFGWEPRYKSFGDGIFSVIDDYKQLQQT